MGGNDMLIYRCKDPSGWTSDNPLKLSQSPHIIIKYF